MANANSSKIVWIVFTVAALLCMAAAVAYFWHKSTVTETETETFALSNGLYLVRIQANGEQRTLKIVL